MFLVEMTVLIRLYTGRSKVWRTPQTGGRKVRIVERIECALMTGNVVANCIREYKTPRVNKTDVQDDPPGNPLAEMP